MKIAFGIYLWCFSILLWSCSQPGSHTPQGSRVKHIYTIDGENLGTAIDLKADIKGALVEIGALKAPKLDEFCGCMIEEVLPLLTKKQVDDGVREGSMFKNFQLPAVAPKVEACMKLYGEGIPLFGTHYTRDSAIKACVESAKESAEGAFTDQVIVDYCNCVVDEVLERDMSLQAIDESGPESEVIFNEIVPACLEAVLY